MKFSEIELPSNRKLGFFFSAIFFLVGTYLIINGVSRLAHILIVMSVVFLMIAFVKPEILLPLNRVWMRFGVLLGMIVSPIVLGVIFFGLFTPISLLMRLFGRDELRLKLVDRASYWKKRDDEMTHVDRFKHQF